MYLNKLGNFTSVKFEIRELGNVTVLKLKVNELLLQLVLINEVISKQKHVLNALTP